MSVSGRRWVRLGAKALHDVASIGFGGGVLTTTGDASSPYSAANDAAVSAMPFGRLEIAPRIAGPVRLSAQGLLGVALPSVARLCPGDEGGAVASGGSLGFTVMPLPCVSALNT